MTNICTAPPQCTTRMATMPGVPASQLQAKCIAISPCSRSPRNWLSMGMTRGAQQRFSLLKKEQFVAAKWELAYDSWKAWARLWKYVTGYRYDES